MTTRRRILVVSDVTPDTIRGGAERALWEQVSRLARRGHRVRVISRSPAEDARAAVERDGVTLSVFPCDRRSALRFFGSSIRGARAAVQGALAEEAADVVHFHQPLSAFGALRSGLLGDIPTLYTFHSPAPLEYGSRLGMTPHHRAGVVGRAARLVLWAVERACLRHATRIHVLSDFSADLVWRLYGIPATRVVKIPGGADMQRFAPVRDRNAVRRRLGLPEAIPLLLSVRNLEARMGLEALIRAVAILRRALPDALLLIGGTGSLRTALESLVAELHLNDGVRLLGYIQDADLPAYYQAADVFVLPTRELEGFGLITIEALACGTPVLATAVGATPEILRPLDASLLFADQTPGTMAERLHAFFRRQVQDRNAADALRRECRGYVERRYDWEHAVSRLEETLGDVTRPASPAPIPAMPCPACAGALARTRLVYAGAPYLRCPRCHTGRIARLPTIAELRTRYETDYPQAFPHDHIVTPRAEMFSAILDRLAALRGQTRLLDIGCGGGHLVASATRRGWVAFGTDVAHAACKATRAVGGCAIQADAAALPFRDASLDAVCLVNLLDHTPDPRATLREAYRVLAPGGHVAIRVPNAAFHRPCIRVLAALGPLVRWRGWDRYPVLHLVPFPASGLGRIAAGVGFRVLKIRNSALAAGYGGNAARGWRARILHGISWLIIAAARVADAASHGHVLIGPSIELFGERPHANGGGVS